jgi:hypothetical protein
MRQSLAFLLFAMLGAAPAMAAELPTRQTKPAATPAKRCEINGKPGILAADGQTCLRFSGYVSGQVSVGNLK